ncbi:response regulator [uncultured Jatrophihabitans sp.]|uniref:response regulator n=1 Tax=uncultured Jatrophihabitans sp. TaxID=1610747 RepID=UPI0035C99D5C
MTEPTTVLIADDQQLVRTGLQMIINAAAGLQVIGEAVNGADAVAEAARLRPDVVLMDVQMPVVDGIEATRRILAGPMPRPRVAVLTTFSQSEIVYDALVAGASGFLLKDMPSVQLIGAIHAVARGEQLLAPELTRRLIEQFVDTGRRTAAQGLDRLTPRELEVLTLVAGGLSNAEIARHLTLGVETIKTHVSRVLDKLGARDRVQAVIVAYESGVVRVADS